MENVIFIYLIVLERCGFKVLIILMMAAVCGAVELQLSASVF